MAIQAQLYSDNIGFPLCGSSDLIDNGCGVGGAGFSQYSLSVQQISHLQQRQQFQHLQTQQQRNQNLCFDSNNRESMMFKQRHQIDQFIKSQVRTNKQSLLGFLQNERLRLLLQEQRKQQFAVLVKKIELKACVLLGQKDEEIAKATNKTMELQNQLKKLEMENQAWQRVAKENEAMVVSLNNTLEQVREQASCRFNNGIDDAESCCECEENKEGMETEENRGFPALVADQRQEPDEEITRKTTTSSTMVCKFCYCRSSCVLLLPCRHLCLCKDCAVFLDSCPVCRTAKKASIKALVS